MSAEPATAFSFDEWQEWKRRNDPTMSAIVDPSGAAIRAGVERGDPLALRGLASMGQEIHSRVGVPSSHLAAQAAGTRRPVPVDGGSLAAGQVGESPFPAGEDSAAMEHERQSRLSRWQAIGSQR